MNKLFLLPLLLTACGSPAPENAPAVALEPKVVNLYSHRHYDTDKELFAAFTEQTGIQVNIVQASDDELMARLVAEGSKSPCDLFITADAGRLGLAKSRGLLQPMFSKILSENIPTHLRDPEGHWFGLTMRARVVAYNKKTVDPTSIVTYTDLTLPKWKGKLLVRSSENVYNQSLVAAMLAHFGETTTATWCKGVVNNMAREPKGGDTDQMLAIAEGLGDIAIVNSYYAGKLLASDEPEKQKAKALIGILFPVFRTASGTTPLIGTHVNVSGGGVAVHAPHPEEAMALLEFLSSDVAQQKFAEGNKEYPVKAGIAVAKELEGFGTYVADELNLEALGRKNGDAVKLLDTSGWR